MRSSLAIVTLFSLGCQPAAQGNADTTAGGDGPSAADPTGGTPVADTGSVTLALDKAAYAPGATVIMSIGSQRSDTLGYNPCGDRSVERETASGWVVHPEPDRMCTMELRLLMPGEAQSAQTGLPGDLTAGTYRIVLRLRPERTDPAPGSSVPVAAVSAPFRVAAP